jgi:hypothetical protein
MTEAWREKNCASERPTIFGRVTAGGRSGSIGRVMPEPQNCYSSIKRLNQDLTAVHPRCCTTEAVRRELPQSRGVGYKVEPQRHRARIIVTECPMAQRIGAGLERPGHRRFRVPQDARRDRGGSSFWFNG